MLFKREVKRSRHSQMLSKMGVFKYFKFTGKQLVESLFNKVADLRPTTLLKRNFNTGSFLWNLLNF